MSKITQEQIMAARAAKSPEEITKIAKDAGIELTGEQAAHCFKLAGIPSDKFTAVGSKELKEEELENVAGGKCGYLNDKFHNCGSSPKEACFGVLTLGSCIYFRAVYDPSGKQGDGIVTVRCYCQKGYFNGYQITVPKGTV